MRNFFYKIGESFRRFMCGRYGSDRLNLALLVVALAVNILCGIVSKLAPLCFLSYFCLIYAIVRFFSRNISARQREASAYFCLKKFFTDRKSRYFLCPGCGSTVRVPRKKGKLSIHCPRCGQRFEKKT